MLLGARQFFERRGGGGWQNPYVTDGLVAMWDGEWPGGVGGQTAQSASEWVDLIHGNIYGSGTGILYDATNKCFDLNKIGRSDAARFNVGGTLGSLDGFSVEVVFEGTFATATYRDLMSFGGYAPVGVGLSDMRISPIGSSRYVNGLPLDTPISYAPTIISGLGNNKAYINGELSVTGNSPTFQISYVGAPNQSANNVSGKIYALRIYSRVLTAAEIAANYAIDKARFNLP